MFKGRLKMFKRTLIAFLCLCMLTESISLSVSATEMPTVIDVDSYDDSMPSNECDEITEETDDEITNLGEESEEEEAFGEEEDSNLLVEEESIILDPQNEMFSKSNSITVCFDGNAEAVTDIPSDISASNEETIIIPNIEPKRDGATFLGWCDELNGYGNYYEPGTELKIKRDLYLYAIWEEEIKEIETLICESDEEGIDIEDEINICEESLSFYSDSNGDMVNKIRNAPSEYTINGTTVYLKGPNTVKGISGMGECFAYANEMYYYLFGSYFSTFHHTKTGTADMKSGTSLVDHITHGNLSNEEYEYKVQELLAKAIPGDVILGNGYNSKNSNIDNHFMIFMYAKDTNNDGRIDEIYTAEGNYDGKNSIAIEKKRSISYFVTGNKRLHMAVYHFDGNILCDHSCGYGSDGLCYNCKTMLPIKTEDYGARGWYEILKGSIDLKESPYKGAKSVLNYCSNDLTKGKLVTVEKAVQNGWYDGKNTTAHKWYLVDYYGQKGYVFQDNLKRVGDWAQPTPTATGSITATKTSVEKGKGIPFDGTITPQNGSITKVVVCFYNTQTGQEIDRKTTSIKNTSSTIKIKNGTIDSNLYVNSLNPGIYKARVYVYLNNGTNKLFESNSFEVRGASASSKPVTVAEPSLSNAPVSSGIGYVEYTLTESTQGASIFYKVGNGAYVQGGSLVNLTLRESTVISAYEKLEVLHRAQKRGVLRFRN